MSIADEKQTVAHKERHKEIAQTACSKDLKYPSLHYTTTFFISMSISLSL
jgi:hypothetical protein